MANGRRSLALVLGSIAAAGLGLAACGDSGTPVAEPPTAGPSDGDTRSGGSGGSESRQQHAKASLEGKTVVLDPGHNGGPLKGGQVFVGNGYKACDTSGTSTNAGYSEHAFTWDTAKRLQKVLQEQGAKVVLTRQDDKGSGPCVDERAAIGNKNKADAVISIHADGAAPGGRGFHVIKPKLVKGLNDGIVAPSSKLGDAVRDAYKSGTGMPYATYLGDDGITVRDDLGGLNLSKVPKIFIETGNMRNKTDAAKLSDPEFRQRMAVAMATGLTRYLKGK
ncbi:N-acetylmuramoyl-L-alanine amidase [Actinocorallia aurantiaca]|uniref:N-acetylmuramoyl-L-alanine amidase n=1 Tax=Actinocorallia aurantiaca TaxID=46204 RepID=A0ABN3UB80_9ACTN